MSTNLPFHEFNEINSSILEEDQVNDTINNATHIPETSLINPSQMPESLFDCFRRRGLHFIHIDTRSIFHKISEIQILALKIKPAVISISESWLENSDPDQSVEIDDYKLYFIYKILDNPIYKKSMIYNGHNPRINGRRGPGNTGTRK